MAEAASVAVARLTWHQQVEWQGFVVQVTACVLLVRFAMRKPVISLMFVCITVQRYSQQPMKAHWQGT
jgi:hypothetical protein